MTPPGAPSGLLHRIRSGILWRCRPPVSLKPMSRHAGGRIVDPVARNPHNVTFARRTRTIRCLCAGERRAKSVVFSAASPILHPTFFDFITPIAWVGKKPDVAAYLAANQVVVAVRSFTVTPCYAGSIGLPAGWLLAGRGRHISFSTRLCSSSFAQEVFPAKLLTGNSQNRNPSLLRARVLILQPLHQGGSMATISRQAKLERH